MQALKNLASLVTKPVVGAVKLAKKVTDFVSQKVSDTRKSVINKIAENVSKVTRSARSALRNIADSTIFRFRKRTSNEAKKQVEEPILIPELEEEPDQPLTAEEDVKRFKIVASKKFKKLELEIERQDLNGNILEIYEPLFTKIYNFIRKAIQKGEIELGFHVSLELDCIFIDPKNPDEPIPFGAKSNSHKRNEVYVSSIEDLSKVLEIVFDEVQNKILSMEESASGLKFVEFTRGYLKLFYYNESPIVNVSHKPAPKGKGYVKLPEWVNKSKSIVNIKNNDERCFVWSILRHFNPEPNSKRENQVTHLLKEKINNYEWFGLDKPETFSEKGLRKFEDKYQVRIVIFEVKENPGYDVIHLRKDLLDVKDDSRIFLGYYKEHYFLIRNFHGFIGCALRHKLSKNNKFFFCEYCFKYFYRRNSLARHIAKCLELKPEIKFPKQYYLQFDKYNTTLRYPAVCYADFESTTLKDGHQIPNSFGFFCPSFEFFETCYSDDEKELFTNFWDKLSCIYFLLMERYKQNEKLEKDVDIKREPDYCKFCNKLDKLVRHHDHFTGEFIGYICGNCNRKAKKPKKIIVFFHNLKGYDSHFIIKQALKYYEDWSKIKPLGRSKEKFFKIPVGKFIFQDSYNHLPFSLSQLIKDYLTEYRFKKFLPLNGEYKHKEAYPYEWFDNYGKFYETEFPPIEAFYSRLTGKTINQKDYEEAKQTYQKYCKKFKDYHDIYLQGDVVLLAEVFEKYRDLSMESYGLDPAWYVSGPSFFYSAMKFMTKAKLPLINNLEVYDLIKSGIRGGICGIGELKSAYKNDKNCIMLMDCVNLYGRAMMEPLPKRILEHVKVNIKENANEFILNLINKNKDLGYIFEVDIHCPNELNDFFRAYPLFPEKKDGKLMQTLFDKEKYVVLDKYLKFGIKLGYKVTKLHSYITIEKSPYMKPYIEFNTNKRREADKLNEKSKVQYYKNANNMVYGKNIENPEKYCNYFILKGQKAIDFYNSPEKYKDFIEIDNDEPIALFDVRNQSLKINSPIIIGFCILDISKYIMAKHFYRLKKIYGDKMKLLYTDTDSFYLLLDMTEQEAINLLKQHDKYFEFPDSPIKKVPGKMAVEKFLKEKFIGIAAKHYITDNEEKCKGIPKNCTTTENLPVRTFYTISSKNHEVQIKEIKKNIKYSDDKKIYLEDGNVFPYGHYKFQSN